MSDPVASQSGFLCVYMSNHPDTLVAYVRHFGKVKTPVVSAKMTSINTKEMVLSYVTPGGLKSQVTISFSPPLSGYEEVKPRLLAMKLDAEESLGMTKRPQVTTFDLRPDALSTVFLLSSLVYATYTVTDSNPDFHIGPWMSLPVGGPRNITYIWLFVVVTHAAEALYAASLCRRHSTGLILGAQWVGATFVLGFPALNRLRKTIQEARINSINKVH